MKTAPHILITGGAGFLARRLIRRLIDDHKVSAVMRDSRAERECDVEHIYIDLTAAGFQDHLPDNVDCVIHLAQSSHYRHFPEGAEDMYRVNIAATLQLLEWARKVEVKQFIFASTANVYGNSMGLLTESDPTQPESFYGASKLAAEHLVRQYQTFFQVDILRIFTMYGPGQKGMLIPGIIDRIRTGQPITLAGGVGLYLMPIYVDDVVAAIRKLVGTPARTQVRLLNACGDRVTHLGEITTLLGAAMGCQANIQFTDGGALCFTGSNEALKRCLGPLRFTDIETGLRLTVSGEKLFC